MGSMSLIHWIIVGAVLLLVFGGRNKISDVMGDVAKGIKSFKKGLSEDDDAKVAPRADDLRSIDRYPPQQPYQPAPQPHPYQQAQPEPQPVAGGEPEQPRRAG